MIQEQIRSLIESKLNNNTAGKVFHVGSYAVVGDKDRSFIYNIKNGYKLIETNFIPAMMDFTANYQAIPLQINGIATIPITFLLKAESQEELESDIEILDQFVAKIVGNYEVITDGTKTYYSVWNMTALMPGGETKPLNGVYYTQIQTTVYVDFSDTNYYGNQYEYSIENSTLSIAASTRIYPYSGTIPRNNNEDMPHIRGAYEAKGLNETSNMSFTMTFYVNSVISKIVDTFASDSYNQNLVFKFSEKTPTRIKTNFSVIINNAVYTPELGEKVTATITFIKSAIAYS